MWTTLTTYSRIARPLEAALDTVDFAAVVADPTQPRRTCVALSNGVGGNETERATVSQEPERPAKKIAPPDRSCRGSLRVAA